MGKTDTKVETQTTTNPDGTITTKTITTITETNADGSKSIKTKTQTSTETPGGGGGGGVPGAVNSSDADKQMKNAPRVKSTTDSAFINDTLMEHNALRAKHGIGPMTVDDDLNQVAQAWADVIAKKGKMEHSTNGFGENVFWASGGEVTGKKASQAWYSEIKDFNWNKIDHTPGTGHFTQLIWKDSVKLGVALATGKNGHFVVANYNPPGNFLGHYPKNIFPPKK